MWMPNQGASAIWYGLNNQEPWKQWMTMMYTMVNMGLGQSGKDFVVFNTMQTTYFPDAASIGTNLFANTISPDGTTLDFMFTDTYYGLSNPNNYFRWNELRVVGSSNTTEYRMQNAWMAELSTVYGLTWQQLKVVKSNWQSLYRTTSDNFFATELTPVNATYQNEFGAAYWQWANGYISQTYDSKASMGEVYQGWYAGYYEISYFKSMYFNTVASQGNIDAFAYVNLYSNELVTNANYEHLFLTFDIYSNDVNSDPPSNSLFNIANFQELIKLGLSTPNILGTDSDMVYGIDFNLDDQWFALAAKLDLEFADQVYFIWLWLYTAESITYNRIPDGGNASTGSITNIGTVAAANAFTTMQLEFPLLVMAEAFSDIYKTTYGGAGCYAFYYTTLGMTVNAETLCATPNFNFALEAGPQNNMGYFQSSLALLTLYFYD